MQKVRQQNEVHTESSESHDSDVNKDKNQVSQKQKPKAKRQTWKLEEKEFPPTIVRVQGMVRLKWDLWIIVLSVY